MIDYLSRAVSLQQKRVGGGYFWVLTVFALIAHATKGRKLKNLLARSVYETLHRSSLLFPKCLCGCKEASEGRRKCDEAASTHVSI